MLWSDPIERALLQMREALGAIQRGNDVPFGELASMLNEALRVREREHATGRIVQP